MKPDPQLSPPLFLQGNFLRKVQSVVLCIEYSDSISKFRIYSPKFNPDPEDLFFNIWNRDTFINPDIPLYDSQVLMMGNNRKLKVTSFDYPPLIIEKVLKDGSLQYSGVEINILNTITTSLGFDYNGTIHKTSDGIFWGGQLSNGTWTGLTGDVIYERTDVGVAQFFIHQAELNLWTLLFLMKLIMLVFYSRNLPHCHLGLQLPFRCNCIPGLPLGLSMTVSMIFVAFYGLVKGPKAEFSTYDGSFYYLGVLFDQSIKSSHQVKNTSFIIFWIGYVYGTLILSWGYRGSLISFLSVPYVPPPMDTIKELANDPITIWKYRYILSFNH